jgi:LysM repeat protein
VEAVRESRPPHYHVAVFPQPYAEYVASLEESEDAASGSGADEAGYRVRNGDSLWTIARAHGLTVGELRAANDLRGSRIYPGQLLRLGGHGPSVSKAD